LFLFDWLLPQNSPKRADIAVRKARKKLATNLSKKLGPMPDTSFLDRVEEAEEEMYGKTSKLTNRLRQGIEKRQEEEENREDDEE